MAQADERKSSFRGDAKHRTRNLEIPGPREDACPGMTETRSSPRQCLFNEARGLKRSRIVAKSGDELHTDWQSTLSDISGNVDARDTHQGLEPVETGTPGPADPLAAGPGA